MKIKDFESGKLVKRYNYFSFEPNKINFTWVIDNPEIDFLLSQANIKLGELNAFSQLIPDVNFFIQMYAAKEATKSSRIEGTQTNIEEVFQKEEYINPEKKDDWREVQNYIKAMNYSIENLERLPLSNRLIKETHYLLLQDVRGEHKEPGEFRHSQNWIGGASINDAVFIHPHWESVQDLMSDLEKFLNNKDIPVPDLIKIAIAHYQFETIHPFLDGNGRIGRLIIALYLVSNDILVKPTLYLSDYFEKNKTLYYDNLTRARTNNDLNQWLKFFLVGVIQTAEDSIQTFKNIIYLRQECEPLIMSLGKKVLTAKSFLNYLFSKPVTDAKEVAEQLEINFSTASRLINDFIRLNILKEITGYRRNRLFLFDKYIELFR